MGTDGTGVARTPAPSTPPVGDARPRGWRAFWLRALPAFAVAAGLIAVIPLDGAGTSPPMRVLLLAGLVVAGVMLTALWVALRLDLRLPVQVAAYAVLFNLLVVATKFVLAPYAVYQTNRVRAFESMMPIDTSEGATATALVVLVLYALGLGSLYLLSRRRLRRRLDSWVTRPGRTRVVVAVLVGLVVMAVAATGGAVLLAAYFVGEPALQYLGFLLSSGISLVIAVTLAGAMLFASMTFRQAEEQALALGNVGVLASLFWVCLAFLALFHVLWVVYLLVVTSVWPLRVVVPK